MDLCVRRGHLQHQVSTVPLQEHLICSPGMWTSGGPSSAAASTRLPQARHRAWILCKLWSRKLNHCKQFRSMTSDQHLTQGSGLKGENIPPRHSQCCWDPKQIAKKKKKSRKLFNITENILSSLIYHSKQAATLQDSLSTFFLT